VIVTSVVVVGIKSVYVRMGDFLERTFKWRPSVAVAFWGTLVALWLTWGIISYVAKHCVFNGMPAFNNMRHRKTVS